jgi:hypothetical protein
VDEKQSPMVNKDDIKQVQTGTVLNMTVATELSTGVTVSGDEFYGKLTKDVLVDGKVVIPKGSIVHGKVDEVVMPKRAGRNGHMKTSFDYIITPDGREIPIDGLFDNKDSGLKAAAKVVGRSAGFTLAGGAVGAIMVLKYGGLPAIAATEGYALAGGAAIGGAVGLTAAMATKGKHAFIQPGAELSLQLQQPMSLPTMTMPDPSANDVKLEGLGVKVLGYRIDKDPFGDPTELTMTLDVNNNTPHTFSTFDIALEDEHGVLHYASPFGDTGLWFSKLTPGTHKTGNLTFNVHNPKIKHTLIFFKQYSREPLSKIALTDGMMVDKKTAKALLKNMAEQ